MSFLLDELWRNALCAVLFPLMLASIGAPIARLATLNFTRPLSQIELICQYLLYGLAIAPPVLDLAGRIGGPDIDYSKAL
jgi:hypothetical protein